jgi:hypothetical protein
LRALVAAVIVVVVGLAVPSLHVSTAGALALFPLILVIYVPFSYYSDLWLYRRRQRKQGESPPREQVRQ